MRRRIAGSIIAVTALAVILFGVPLAVLAQRSVDEQETLRLERRAVLASRQVPGDFATSNDPVELPTGGATSYSLYDRTGRRVTGTPLTSTGGLVGEALTNRVAEAEQGERRVVAIPIVDHEKVVGALVASESTHAADARATRTILAIAGLGLLVIAIGAVVAHLVAGRLARPIEEIRDEAVRLGDGEFDVHLPPIGVTELDEASAALEVTARRLADLVSRERAFSADASHQLRTPLAALRASLEAELSFPREPASLVLEEALEDVDQLEQTIEQLLRFARDSEVAPATTALDPLLASVRTQWNGRFAAVDRPLVVAGSGEPLHVVGGAGVLRQALDVLLDNALVHGAGRVRIGVRSTEAAVTISVTDHGSGFSSDQVGSLDGTHGRGLPLARRLVESCGGKLVIANDGPSPSVELVVRRPITTKEAANDPSADPSGASDRSSG